MRRTRSEPARQRGFTLIEMVVSITLIGLLAMVAAPLLRLPLVAWMDASRRAQLTDAIDTANAKLADDLRRALPNSVRIRSVGNRVLLEMLEVRASGRHRNGPSGAAQACAPAVCGVASNTDSLETACSETCFTSLGPMAGDPLDPPVPGSDWVVVNPLGPGVPSGDPYFGGNVQVANGIKTLLTNIAAAADGNRVRIGAHTFPAVAASHRFYVVSTPVTWDCDPATQRLTRRWGYPVSAVQPTVFNAGSSALLATNVAAPRVGSPACFSYTAAGSAGRGGVVQVVLRLSVATADTRATEAVELVASYAVSEGP